jgi:hypothetical protein
MGWNSSKCLNNMNVGFYIISDNFSAKSFLQINRIPTLFCIGCRFPFSIETRFQYMLSFTCPLAHSVFWAHRFGNLQLLFSSLRYELDHWKNRLIFNFDLLKYLPFFSINKLLKAYALYILEDFVSGDRKEKVSWLCLIYVYKMLYVYDSIPCEFNLP